MAAVANACEADTRIHRQKLLGWHLEDSSGFQSVGQLRPIGRGFTNRRVLNDVRKVSPTMQYGDDWRYRERTASRNDKCGWPVGASC